MKPRKPRKLLTALAILTFAILAVYFYGIYVNNGEPLPAKWKGTNTNYQDTE